MLRAMPQEIFVAAAWNGLDDETVEKLCQVYLEEFKSYPGSFGDLLRVIE